MNDIQLPLFDIPLIAVTSQPILVNSNLDEASLRSYDKPHCWQYDIRHNNLTEDILESGIKPEVIAAMAVTDFTFRLMCTDDEKEQAIDFIKRHEWLGTISQYTTHWYGAYYFDQSQELFGRHILAGVILMNLPNAMSKMLGDDTRIERLISRGACVSWSPKCLASRMMMWCIRDMVTKTEFRLFTAYSDPAAKELGTIYQACNFYYLGNRFGASTRYINPYTGKIVSDRFFRQKSAYKLYARELGINWDDNWIHDGCIDWTCVPLSIENSLRSMSREKQSIATSVLAPKKHKYAYVLGKSKVETKRLRMRFLEANKVYSYPSVRGE
jgi:hypothetical protein